MLDAAHTILLRALGGNLPARRRVPARKPTEAEREEYHALLDRFRLWCEDRGQPFQEGMRAAVCAAMGERPKPPPARRGRGRSPLDALLAAVGES